MHILFTNFLFLTENMPGGIVEHLRFGHLAYSLFYFPNAQLQRMPAQVRCSSVE